jgi:hypothetical protein
VPIAVNWAVSPGKIDAAAGEITIETSAAAGADEPLKPGPKLPLPQALSKLRPRRINRLRYAFGAVSLVDSFAMSDRWASKVICKESAKSTARFPPGNCCAAMSLAGPVPHGNRHSCKTLHFDIRGSGKTTSLETETVKITDVRATFGNTVPLQTPAESEGCAR